jgi:tRNA pseudouridine38-40 synthase
MLKKYYYKLTIAYDGANYCGWQMQKNSPSIHEEMMKAGKSFLDEGFTVTGCSRTDSGVHALNYAALLVTTKKMDVRRILGAYNAHLPRDIVLHDAQEVNENFHPRYTSKNKHYRYTIFNNKYPIPQFMQFSHYCFMELDVEAMNVAAKAFVGTHDFIGFSSMKTTVKNTTRRIDLCEVAKNGNYIEIDIIGKGFLYNMVRIIAGSLIEVGLGKIKPEDMALILESKDRSKARITAPAKGLTLVGLEYDDL